MRKIWLWITNVFDGFVAFGCGVAILALAVLAWKYDPTAIGAVGAIAVYGVTILLFGRYLVKHRGSIPDDSSQTWVDNLISSLPGFAAALFFLWGEKADDLLEPVLFALASIPFAALCTRIVSVRRLVRSTQVKIG